MIESLILLLGWHALADYPLQGDFLAKAKNPSSPIPGVPWWQALWAHSVIHAAGVMVITGFPLLAGVELVGHALTDWAKCKGKIGFNVDQAVHVAMKAGYVWWLS